MSLVYVSQAVLETVAKITHEKTKKNDTQEAKYGMYIIHCENVLNIIIFFYFFINNITKHVYQWHKTIPAPKCFFPRK